MLNNGYKMIMWGILISGLHININGFQILPAFIGYLIIILGINKLCESGAGKYFEKIKKTATLVFVLSVASWIVGSFLGYEYVLMKMLMILFYLLELVLYADILNMSVKILKDTNRTTEADKMRNNRMLMIKVFLGVIILHGVAVIPQLSGYLAYACQTLMVLAKIIASMYVQNMTRYQITLNNE